MKAKTVEQFKILDYIEDNFNMSSIELTLLNRNTIRVRDINGSEADFILENNKIEFKEV